MCHPTYDFWMLPLAIILIFCSHRCSSVIKYVWSVYHTLIAVAVDYVILSL